MNSTNYIDEFQDHFGVGSTSTPMRLSMSPLHKALIGYATKSARLLFIQELSAFNDFYYTNETFNDISTMELREIMLNSILPNVHLYQLTAAAKNRLKLLELHPCFRQTPQGYQYTPLSLSAQFVLQPKCDFSVPAQLPSLLASQDRLNAVPDKGLTRVGGASHTLLCDAVAHDRLNFPLSFDIAALVSSFVSTDLELSSSELLDLTEIQRRLQRAKLRFEQTGNMSPYRHNLEQLTNNMATFDKLKEKLLKSLFNV